jgi:N-acetylglutamate synthase-like GNAT family acetyltransferase
MLAALSRTEQNKLLAAMRTIERLLTADRNAKVGYVLRPHVIGDMGWVLQRHGLIYAREYGWGKEFEAHVAGTIVKFMEQHDPNHERFWIAELEGDLVGCACVARAFEGSANLDLLLVDPSTRRQGIGTRLLDECIRFAREARYRSISVSVADVMQAARRLFKAAGFHQIHECPTRRFEHDFVLETWELAL